MEQIPFNMPYLTGKEGEYISSALASLRHCGNNAWGARCIGLMKEMYPFGEVFLTPSGTAALEMGAMLAGLGPGDEVILPSYTFSSTANAVLLQGAVPVFCEVEPATMNIDAGKIEALITRKTKMIMPIDYAGIPCDIAAINEVAARHGLTVFLDAAQSFHSRDAEGHWAGTSTPIAAFSFHETKNLGCGEGGALVVNRDDWVERAHFLQEKGTDRRLVLSGVRNKYGWVDKGSSFLLGDILAAMLVAQLENVDQITQKRRTIYEAYSRLFEPFEAAGFLRVPHPPRGSKPNSHAYFVIFDKSTSRDRFIARLKDFNIAAYIGYVPLHSFTKGRELGYKAEDLPLTEDLAARIVRLPFYTGLADRGLDYTLKSMSVVLQEMYDSSGSLTRSH